MNPVVNEMLYLAHYGMPRRSGRYPWGSGDNPYQHTGDFLSRVEELKKQGWTETAENIKKEFGLTTKEYRMEKSICKDQRRMLDVARAKSLAADGLGPTEIGRIMGKNESSVRELLDPKREEKMKLTIETVNLLRDEVDKQGMIDVGVGLDKELNISKERLDLALYYLEEKEGYPVYNHRVQQVTNRGQWTTERTLCVPGTEYSAVYDLEKIGTVKDYISRDGGLTYEKKFTYPSSMDSSRMMIRYNEDGGIDKDGIVELRRGVADLSLGESRYSQVRILVDGTHYIKGMAVYSDNMPDGVDVIFNTNKTKGTPMTKVLKEIKNDPDNPFGSAIKDADQGGQYWYDPKTGQRVSASHPGAKLGLINKRADEGDWSDWKDTLPSQFLGKQSKAMIDKQLNLAKADRLAEFDDICSLTNPTVKKHLLQKFSDECDAAAVDLKAAALPGQKYHVIIPVNTLKDTEVYAPNYENGTKLALIRYPHGGTFEIPILTVNNKHREAKDLLGSDISDAVGINKKVADRLSGADFDGDTVMCIPTHDKHGKVKVVSTPPLKALEDFDPKLEYPERKGMKYMKDPVTGKDNTQNEMGVISNLITDMTIAGASPDKLARAVKHSMVVIDAAKHKLDYKRSEEENNIAALKKEFQRGVDKNGNVKYGGASTILSRSSGQATVDKRQGNPKVNIEGKSHYDPTKPEGSYIYKKADDLYYVDRKYDKSTGIVTLRTASGKKITYDSSNKEEAALYAPVKKKDPHTGDVIFTNKAGDITYKALKRTQKSTRMAETDDAYALVSEYKHPTEMAYAEYANSMKALANRARKEMVTTGKIVYSSTAKETYATEVSSLMAKLNKAELNKTRERAAQRLANVEVNAKKAAREDTDDPMSKSDVRKASQQAITKYRTEVGAKTRKERNIEITDREWEAIQAGAISEAQLKRILNNTDTTRLRELATPRATKTLSQAKINKIKAMSDSNHSLADIAAACGVSTTTVANYLKGVN